MLQIQSLLHPKYDVDPHKVIARSSKITLEYLDIECLAPKTWLNDKVINFYFGLIQKHHERMQHRHPKVLCMDTYHFQSIEMDFERTKDWKIDVFEYDFILFPINANQNHWIIVTIDFVKKEVVFYDSSKYNCEVYSQTILEWISWAKIYKKSCYSSKFERSEFIYKGSPLDLPKQLNNVDCGVFCCMIGRYIVNRKVFNFSEKHMPYFRYKMAYEILSSKLMDDDKPKLTNDDMPKLMKEVCSYEFEEGELLDDDDIEDGEIREWLTERNSSDEKIFQDLGYNVINSMEVTTGMLSQIPYTHQELVNILTNNIEADTKQAQILDIGSEMEIEA